MIVLDIQRLGCGHCKSHSAGERDGSPSSPGYFGAESDVHCRGLQEQSVENCILFY